MLMDCLEERVAVSSLVVTKFLSLDFLVEILVVDHRMIGFFFGYAGSHCFGESIQATSIELQAVDEHDLYLRCVYEYPCLRYSYHSLAGVFEDDIFTTTQVLLNDRVICLEAIMSGHHDLDCSLFGLFF